MNEDIYLEGAMSDMDKEIILQVGAEGGEIALYGRRKNDTWLFWLETDETTLNELITADDKHGIVFNSKTYFVNTWEEALDLLDEYPWCNLYPLKIHPEIGTLVWKEVIKRRLKLRTDNQLYDWFILCFPGKALAYLRTWLGLDDYYLKMVKGLCISTTKDLFSLDNEIDGLKKQHSKLLFPQKGGSVRVSEQEARFLFYQKLQSQDRIYCSVETPTLNTYKFTGQVEQRANIDMSLFDNLEEELIRKVNLEFKAKVVPYSNYWKDLLKLVYEGSHGVFFQILDASDNGTIIAVMNKFKECLNKIKSDPTKLPKHSAWFLHFHICSLNPQVSLNKTFKAEDFWKINEFFYFKYNISKSIFKIEEDNGWELGPD